MMNLESSVRYCDKLSGEGETLSKTYLDSDKCTVTLAILDRYLSSGCVGQMFDLQNSLVGRVCEDVVAVVKNGRGNTGDLVMDSHQLVRIIAKALPVEIISNFGGLQESIRGMSIPDLMVLGESRASWQIIEIIESKVTPDMYNWRLRSQVTTFKNRRLFAGNLNIDHQGGQEWFGKQVADLFQVIEKPVKIHPKCKIVLAGPHNTFGDWGGRKIPLPISRDEMFQISENMLSDVICEQMNTV